MHLPSILVFVLVQPPPRFLRHDSRLLLRPGSLPFISPPSLFLLELGLLLAHLNTLSPPSLSRSPFLLGGAAGDPPNPDNPRLCIPHMRRARKSPHQDTELHAQTKSGSWRILLSVLFCRFCRVKGIIGPWLRCHLNSDHLRFISVSASIGCGL